MTVHPGIGYDIIANHPVFSGSAIGRAAEWDFKLFGGSVQDLDGGVVLSVGSAIMGPQVFEKALSCVNNLRLQDGPGCVRGHTFYVVDLQDGGGWDWTKGEPPKDESRLLSPLLQELFADGRCAQLRAVRQHDVHSSSLSPVERDMTNERFHAIANRYPRLRIGVAGDFFLDRYLHIDPAKAETSIETGLPVYNVVEVRSQPGAAGTILNNLVALGVGEIHAIGFCGDDGEGYELRRALEAQPGVTLEHFITSRRASDSGLLQAALDRGGQGRLAS